MSLDLDGILHVTAIEKRSGLSKHITIARALETKSEAEIAAARKRLELLYLTGQGVQEEEDAEEEVGEGSEEVFDEDLVEALSAPLESSAEKDDWSVVAREGKQLIERSRQSLGQLHADDREEAIDLNAQIESAIDANDVIALKQAAQELRELLFFVEGRSA